MTEPPGVSAVAEPTPDQLRSGGKGKWKRRLRRTVIAMLALVVAVLGISTGINQAANAIGLAKLDIPGELVEVDGEARMHVSSSAEHSGGPTLVFLAGSGLGSAYYELQSIWEPLAEDFNIATVDYLGYGFSTAPGQLAPEDYEGDLSQDGGLHPIYTVFRFMGLTRVERWINGDDSVFLPANPLLDEAEQDQDWLLDNTKLDLLLLADEESWYLRNDLALQGQRFDAAIPTLMVAQDTVEATSELGMPDWVEVHRAIASEHPQSLVVTLDGSHLIYLDAPDHVVSQIRQFLS